MCINMYKLDAKDKKILEALDRNSRQSNSQIGKSVRLSKEVVKYRIDKLIEEKVIVRFHTIINYFKLGISKHKLYLRLTNANQEKIDEIAKYFYSEKNTEWVAVTTGKWDLIVGFLVKNINEFDDELQKFFNKFSGFIQEKAVTSTLYLAHNEREFNSNNLSTLKNSIVYHTSKDVQEKIDEIDEKILRILANNARISIIDLARKIKTTPRIVQYRMKYLEKRKIILAYRVNVSSQFLGKIFAKAIIYINTTKREKLDSFIAYASSIQGALWPQRVLGSWDFELDLETSDYDSFQKIILDLKEKFPDLIRGHDFCILSKEYKLDLYLNAEREI